MASSFVGFKQKGFWCQDEYLETWLLFFVKEIESEPNRSPWLEEMKNKWYEMATVGMIGSIDLFLDKVIISEERKEVLGKIGLRVNDLLSAHGGVVPLEIINPVLTGIGAYTEPPEASNWLKAGILFIELLNERITATASSPLDYLRPENWRDPKNLNNLNSE